MGFANPITSLPAGAIIGDIPVERITGNFPAERIAGDIPVTQVSGDLPITRVSGDVPTERLAGDIPAGQISGSIPVTQVSGDLPAERIAGGTLPATYQVAGALIAGEYPGPQVMISGPESRLIMIQGVPAFGSSDQADPAYVEAVPDNGGATGDARRSRWRVIGPTNYVTTDGSTYFGGSAAMIELLGEFQKGATTTYGSSVRLTSAIVEVVNSATVGGLIIQPAKPRAVVALTGNYAHTNTTAQYLNLTPTGGVLTGSITATGNTRVTVGFTGTYLICAQTRFSIATANNVQLATFIRRNGTTVLSTAYGAMSALNVTVSHAPRLVELAAGDYLELGLQAASGITAQSAGNGTHLAVVFDG